MPVQIYGAKNCASCNTAKDVCDAFSIDYDYLELDKDYTMSDLMDVCMENGLALPRGFPLILDTQFKSITIEQLKQLI